MPEQNVPKAGGISNRTSSTLRCEALLGMASAKASRPVPQSPQIGELPSPLRPGMLKPLKKGIRVVQFTEPLSDRKLKRAARLMESYPDG